MADAMCTQDCVWMGREIESLRNRIEFLEDALKKSVEDCDSLRRENDRLRDRIDLISEYVDHRLEDMSLCQIVV